MQATILAGGKATRCCGLPKGNFKIDSDLTIIERLICAIRDADICDVVLSANEFEPYLHYQIPIIKDNYCNSGPLAGIEAVLTYYTSINSAKSDAGILFLPCDVPSISSAVIKSLLNAYQNQQQKTVVYAKTSDELIHPLCAIVNSKLLPVIRKCLQQGICKIQEVWKMVDANSITFTDSKIFLNINYLSEPVF